MNKKVIVLFAFFLLLLTPGANGHSHATAPLVLRVRLHDIVGSVANPVRVAVQVQLKNTSRHSLLVYDLVPDVTVFPKGRDAQRRSVKLTGNVISCPGADRRKFLTLRPGATLEQTFFWDEEWRLPPSPRPLWVYLTYEPSYLVTQARENGWKVNAWRGKLTSNALPLPLGVAQGVYQKADIVRKQDRTSGFSLPALFQSNKPKASETGNQDEKGLTPRKNTNSNQEDVLVASIPNRAAKNAWAALDRAGIAYGTGGSRSTGIYVRKQDFARSKEVLKADAQSHRYKILFAD